jgi:uncharacterized protein (TIGR03435 family)
MTVQAAFRRLFGSMLWLCAAGLAATTGHSASGQASAAPQATNLSAKPPEFEVASVRRNKSNGEASINVDPTFSDGSVPTGGLYLAKNIKLIQFIAFAYRLTQSQLLSVESKVPWTTEERFDIEARAEGNPTKAQYRLMMQTLLADRFKLKAHYDTRQVPVYALVLAKPGKLGPHLRLHRLDDPVCATDPSVRAAPSTRNPAGAGAEEFPNYCGGLSGMKPSAPGRMKSGGRDVTMALLAGILVGVGVVDRPMVDETGLKGTVDFSLEWRQVAGNVGFGGKFDPDESAPTFQEALRDQLGIKMVSQKSPVDFFIVDHIESPSAN